jgi:hypothetical protein
MKVKTLKQKLQKTSKDRIIRIVDDTMTLDVCNLIYDKEKKICYIVTIKLNE